MGNNGTPLPEYAFSEDSDTDYDEEDFYSENEYPYDQYYDYYSTDDPQEFFSCDTCDQDFSCKQYYEKHMSEHRVCGIENCTFTAHEKIIEKHISIQHTTGLYDKIRNINTPEDIARWIEDRKMKYPSKENVEKRYQAQEERLKRGEKIGERKNRFGRDKTRLTQQNKGSKRQLKTKNTSKTNKIIKQLQPKSLIDDKADWNGTMFPFRGTSNLYEMDKSTDSIEFEDNEWESSRSQTKDIIKVNTSLGALMGAYASDCSESEDEIPAVKKAVIPKLKSAVEVLAKLENDTEKPDEVPIIRNSSAFPIEEQLEQKNEKQTTPNTSKRKRTSKNFNKNGVNSKKSPLSNKSFKKRKITLLERLLDSEIRHERNVLLQCVRFVVDNNFFTLVL